MKERIKAIAINYGADYLFELCEEECGEYIVAARHNYRKDRPEDPAERFSEMLKEAADVYTVLLVIRAQVGPKFFDSMVSAKLQRWQHRMWAMIAKAENTLENAPCCTANH